MLKLLHTRQLATAVCLWCVDPVLAHRQEPRVAAAAERPERARARRWCAAGVRRWRARCRRPTWRCRSPRAWTRACSRARAACGSSCNTAWAWRAWTCRRCAQRWLSASVNSRALFVTLLMVVRWYYLSLQPMGLHGVVLVDLQLGSSCLTGARRRRYTKS